jgi:hypothetical protein
MTFEMGKPLERFDVFPDRQIDNDVRVFERADVGCAAALVLEATKFRLLANSAMRGSSSG